MRELNNEERLVWDEFIQAASWEKYISEYIGYRLFNKKWFNIVAIIFATISAATWGFWKSINAEWVPFIMFMLLGISQLLTALSKDVTVDEHTIKSMNKLRSMYISYFDSLESLFLDILRDKYSSDEIKEKYYALRKQILPIQELKDLMDIKPKKRIMKKVEKDLELQLMAKYCIEIDQ